jgi:hypothetical protein
MKTTLTVKFEITNWHIEYAIQSLLMYNEKVSKSSIEKTIKEYLHNEGYDVYNYSHIDDYHTEAQTMARKLYPDFY